LITVVLKFQSNTSKTSATSEFCSMLTLFFKLILF
jgi:hypothetical protein